MTDAPVQLRPEVLAQAAYKQGRPAPANAFKLSSNELPFPLLDEVAAAAADLAGNNRYPDASCSAVREAIGEHYRLDADRVLVGAGSVALLQQAITSAAGPGDEVIYPWRSFEAYPSMMTHSGARAVPVSLTAEGRMNFDAIAEAVTERTRCILVCSPNNPTGPAASHREFEQFMEQVPEHVLVIADEAYYEFVTDPKALNAARLLDRFANLVVARTFSKAYGLAGMRIGYMLGHPAILNAVNTVAIPFAVSAPSQSAALAVMRAGDAVRVRVNEVTARRDEIWRALYDQGWAVPETQANFVWLPCREQVEGVDAILRAGGIIARAFSGDGIRISIGEEASVTPLLAACWQAIERYPYLRRTELL